MKRAIFYAVKKPVQQPKLVPINVPLLLPDARLVCAALRHMADTNSVVDKAVCRALADEVTTLILERTKLS
jgi:hypothetical protein